MKGEFNEQYADTNVIPEGEAATNFDWDSLFERLGEPGHELTERDSRRLAWALSEILKWLLRVDLTHKRSMEMVGKKTIAMAYVVDPTLLNGDSLRALAKQIGSENKRAKKQAVTAASISRYSSEFSRLYKIINEHQKHDWRKDHEKADQQ